MNEELLPCNGHEEWKKMKDKFRLVFSERKNFLGEEQINSLIEYCEENQVPIKLSCNILDRATDEIYLNGNPSLKNFYEVIEEEALKMNIYINYK